MTWNDVGLERSGLLHFLIGKMHLLRNFNSAKVCEGSLGRGHPQEVDVDPQSQGRKLMGGSVAGPMLALMKNLSYLSLAEKKN